MTYEEAKTYLGSTVTPKGNLYELGWYLAWNKTESFAVLDGEFNADDLEAIAVYMRGEATDE